MRDASPLPVHDTPPRSRDVRVRLLLQQSTTALLGGLVVALFTAISLRSVVPRETILPWLSVTLTVQILRLAQVRYYRRAFARHREKTNWEMLFTLGILASGATWGWAAIALLPESGIVYQAFFVVIISGMSAAAAVTYAPIRYGSAAFILPAMLPLALRFSMMSETLHLSMALVILLSALFLVVAALNLHSATLRSVTLGDENAALVDYLARAKAEGESLNRELRAENAERRAAEDEIRRSQTELAAILDNMQDTYYRTDEQGRLTHATPSAEKLLGYRVDELLGMPLAELYAIPGERQRFLAKLEESGGSISDQRSLLRHKDGHYLWVSTNAQYCRDATGKVVGIEGTTRDITGLIQAEEALQRETERALVTLRSIGDGVITTDNTGHIDYVNPVAERLVGYTVEAARGRHYLEVLHLVDETTGDSLDDLVKLCLGETGSVVHADNGLLTHPDGSEYAIKVTAAPMRDSDNRVVGAVLVLHDITEVLGMARQLNYQATHDMLTGLINRREFDSRLDTAIRSAREEGAQHALLYMDLDQFKLVNDTCGHQAGDELLTQLAVLLHHKIRESDVLARLGGDEFGVLLHLCPLARAEAIAEELLEVVQGFRFVWQEKTFQVGISIGVVQVTAESGNRADLLSAADAACYVAKDQGRNRVYVYERNDGAVAQHHGEMEWVHRITSAFEEDRFELYAQSIVPLRGQGERPHYEVLMRMRDPDGKVVPPMAFIPAAERYNLMPSLDRWVVRTTLSKLREAQGPAKSPPFDCAINLSGQSLCDDHFLHFVIEQLEDTGIPCETVCFEVTETAAIINLTRAMRFIGVLHGMGCRFALDDFGTGFSSFAYLKHLPVDYLKIDGSFVKEVDEDRVARAMVASINEVGHVMGIKTIAEFVENQAIEDVLRQIGIDFAQGYGISRPQPLDEVLNQVNRRSA